MFKIIVQVAFSVSFSYLLWRGIFFFVTGAWNTPVAEIDPKTQVVELPSEEDLPVESLPE